MERNRTEERRTRNEERGKERILKRKREKKVSSTDRQTD
jgi:hypothetical protein